MRIVVHGQEAFGKAVLEKLLERKENVVAVFCAPDKAGRAEDPLEVVRPREGPHRASAEELEVAGSVRVHEVVQRRPVRDGLRDAVRAAARARCTPARHDPVSPLAAARAPRALVDQLADRHGPDARRGCRSSGPTRGSMRDRSCCRRRSTDRPRRDAGRRLLQEAVSAGRRCHDGEHRSGARRQGAEGHADHSKKTYESWFKKDVAEIDWAKPVAESTT